MRLRDDLADERAALVAEHARELDEQATQLLRTSGDLLRWAITAPLAEDRFDVIEEHIKPLVQVESIRVVAVADESGRIRIATDHKLEGKTLEDVFLGVHERAGQTSEVVVTPVETGLVTVIPVRQDERAIGTAVLLYQRR